MPLYETICKLQETLKETIEKQQRQGEIDLVTFTSASTVRGFVQALPGIDTTKIRAVCIGEQTANEAKRYGMQIQISEEASVESMVLKILEAGRRLERRAYSGKIHRKTACYRDSFLVCSGNGYIFSDQGNSGKSFSGSKCVGECAADDGGRIWITSAGRGPVCHIYEASASRKSGIFLSKSVRIGCKYHSKILAGDCGDRSSGDSSGNDRRNRDWSLADFFETQAASGRAFYWNTSDRRMFPICGSTFADACIWSLAEMAAGQWTGFLEKLHSPGMRSGAVSRLFAGTADRDTSCQEKQRDYVLLARTKGLKKRQILFTHILPHIWIPVLNYLGPASAFLLTGSFVVESIFTIPGLADSL